jgi:hypothetical protein
MTTTLSLHHVGEVVLCGLLDGLARRDRLHAVPCKLHPDCSLLSVMTKAAIRPPYLFADNVPLAPDSTAGKTVRFDGAHGVDVLCHDGQRGLPVEAKLGLDRLTCAAFTERFLHAAMLSSHKSPQVTGSMIVILDERRVEDAPLTLRTTDPPVEVVGPWFLVLRARTWNSWATERPSLLNAHVAVFEEIAEAYGDATAFDALVLAQVGGGFHSAWKVS